MYFLGRVAFFLADDEVIKINETNAVRKVEALEAIETFLLDIIHGFLSSLTESYIKIIFKSSMIKGAVSANRDYFM